MYQVVSRSQICRFPGNNLAIAQKPMPRLLLGSLWVHGLLNRGSGIRPPDGLVSRARRSIKGRIERLGNFRSEWSAE